MKTQLNDRAVARRPGARSSWLALSSALLLSVATAAEPPPAEPPAAPKDHALFVGGTLWVETGGGSQEVIDVNDSEVQVLADGRRERVPVKNLGAVRLVKNLKLSNLVAQIDKFECEPVAGPGEIDPETDQLLQMIAASQMADAARDAEGMALREDLRLRAVPAAIQNPSERPGVMMANPDYEAAQTKIDSNLSSMASSQAAAISLSGMTLRGVDRAASAASLEVSGVITLPAAAGRAFLLVDTEYRQTKGGAIEHQLYLHPVRGLGPSPKTVRFFQGGFPRDFVWEKTSLYLYVNGMEVATNLSPNRVDITADDALRYLVMSHIASHPKESLAAVPLRIALPADFKQQAGSAAIGQPIFLTVAADGTVLKSAADASGSRNVDPYLDSVVRKFRFGPALKDGKAVESVVEFKVGDYLR